MIWIKPELYYNGVTLFRFFVTTNCISALSWQILFSFSAPFELSLLAWIQIELRGQLWLGFPCIETRVKSMFSRLVSFNGQISRHIIHVATCHPSYFYCRLQAYLKVSLSSCLHYIYTGLFSGSVDVN